MCVIIVKGKNQDLPKKKSLKNCFNRNSDGAGFMYVGNDNKVVIDKGYMSFESFYKRYKKLCKKFNNFKGKNLVMHMRISTAGGVKKENTHPFPLTNDFNAMKYLKSKCDVGIMHNGIISATNPTRVQESNGVNDTMIFIQKYLFPIYKDWKKCFENKSFLSGIINITNSKFAILDKNDKLYMVGDFKKYEGNYYSNDSYEGYNYSFGNYSYNYYEDYYGDYWDEDYYNKYYSRYSKEKNDEKIDIDSESSEDSIEKSEKEDLIVCNDYDCIAFDDEYDYIEVGELRTEDKSIFIYDTGNFTLEEIKDDKIINKYYNCALLLENQI